MKPIILLLALSVFTPTLVDVSDYNNYQQGIPKYVTAETIPNKGFVLGRMTLADGHYPIIGLVDQDAFYYSDCGEGCGYFVTNWEVKAFLTDDGLQVWQDNQLLCSEKERPYTDFFADVKIYIKGVHLYWYLNDKLICSTKNPEIVGKQLRGFYQDDFAENWIGVP